MKIVIACRHGEAYKNLKNIYGGSGSGLTDAGIEQINELSKEINQIIEKTKLPVRIFKSCTRVQINESADILSNQLGIETVEMDENFKPIRLGVFDGMSRNKQLELYPEACEAHQKWENGLIDIKESEKLVEGMQSAVDYYNQIKNFIDSLPDDGIYVLMGTRSDASCIKNVFMNQTPEIDMQYKYYNFGYAQTSILISDSEKTKVVDDINPKSFNIYDEKVI